MIYECLDIDTCLLDFVVVEDASWFHSSKSKFTSLVLVESTVLHLPNRTNCNNL
jgi:hypothetical protein